MPDRVSVRAARAARASEAAISRKSSTQTLKSRSSASTRTSALAVEIPDEGPNTSLRAQICSIFADAQKSTATQRKLVINLRKIHEACCYEPVKPNKQRTQEEFGEAEFNKEVARCVLRVLCVKKSEQVGDKIVRFLGLFLKYASEKDNAIAQPPDADTTDAFPETPSNRLTSHIISLLLPLLAAKDKTVRFRSTQIIAHIINTLDSIDDELFQLVRLGLLKRLRDKESAVRVQAVLGLGRLADEGGEDDENDDSDDESAGGVLEKLLDVLQNDPSADVRRALLLNLPFTPATLPYLLERARDLDAGTRRALYSRLLPALGDFRHLSLTHREKLLRWGMRDRDENVRKATARLFRERWIEDCAGLRDAAEQGPAPAGQVSKPSYDALLELLERIDVVNSGVEEGIAFEAMKEFWDGRPDYREYIYFEDPFWDQLTPESVFVARTFNDYCRQTGERKLQAMVEEKMPEVTKLAFLLQKHINALVGGVQRVALLDDAEAEEDTVQQEFCVEQLLHIALTLDYSDEVGRRTMYSVMREALALPEVPEECTKLIIEVLKTVCGSNAAGEREFCNIVLEAVAEVHDAIMEEEPSKIEDAEESFHSARSELSEEHTPTKAKKVKKPSEENMDDTEQEQNDEEKAIREIMVNMKCLHIAQCMLQNVQCDLEQNGTLVTMLNNLVVPAVRSQEAPIRERGLLCLGLCCLLSKNLAEENLTLFLHCFTKGHEALQSISLQIISDVLTTHPSILTKPTQPLPSNSDEDAAAVTENQPSNPLHKPVHKLYARALASPLPTIQTTATIALSKLLLSTTLRDPDLLRAMVLAYFDPDTRPNPALRQALSYFLPAYCHSRRANAVAMARVAVGVVRALVERAEEFEEEEEGEMVGMGVVGGLICEWTDGRRGVGDEEEGDGEALDAHVVLAGEILERVLTPGCAKEEKKPLLSLLPKLHLPPATPRPALQTLSALAAEAADSRAAADAPSRNALNKLQTTLAKLLASSNNNTSDEDRPDRDATAVVVQSVEQDVDADGDVTMATQFAEPDAEGTVMQAVEEEEEDDAEAVVGREDVRDSTAMTENSLVESLLEDE